MSRKDILTGYKLVDSQSLASSFNSNPITMGTKDNVAINISATSVTDNTGVFSIQHRILKSENVLGDFSDWNTLTLDMPPTLANASAVLGVYLNQVPPGQLRVVFTAAGGTPDGSVVIWVSMCSVGA